MSEKTIILPSDGAAARKVTGLSGWVAPDGQWWGDDERMARWCGATHVPCSACQTPVEKSWTLCGTCRAKKDEAKYFTRERKPYDGGWVYSEKADRFFQDEDELREYCETYDYAADSLRLRTCEPVYARQIDPNEYYLDELPEDGEVPGDIADAFDQLNAAIAACKVPLSWQPTEYAVEKLDW